MWVVQLLIVQGFEKEFPPVNVDDPKSPVRQFKKLVRTSQKATARKVLQTSYAADSSWSDDLLPNEHMESTPPHILQRGGRLTSRDLLFRLYVARRSLLETTPDARTRVRPVKTAADSSRSGEANGGQKCVRIVSHCQTVD